MSRAKRSFKEANAVGDRGVAYIMANYQGWAPPPEGERRHDLERSLRVEYTGDAKVSWGLETLEVKTDTYDHTATPNFFIEQYTERANGSEILGGPWRTVEHGVDIFAYVFLEPTPLLYVWRDVPRLVGCLEQLIWQRSTHQRIINSADGMRVRGWLVRRNQLAKLYGEPDSL